MDLVTGGHGFVGKHVVTLLRQRGRSVRVLDLRPPARDADPAVEHLRGSITDRAAVWRALDGVERVFHLAAVPELWARDKDIFDRVNRVGTECLLEGVRRHGQIQRFVYTSSEVVLLPADPRRTVDPLTEAAVYPPEELIGAYARSKRAGERAVLDAAARELSATVVIPTVPIGPGDTAPTPPTRMLNDLLMGRMPAYPDVWIDIVDVRDAALGHLLAADRGVSGTRYLLAGHSLRMGEFLARVARSAGVAAPRFIIPDAAAMAYAHLDTLIADISGRPPRAPRDGARIAARMRSCDPRRAQTCLGFEPRALVDTVDAAVASLRPMPDAKP